MIGASLVVRSNKMSDIIYVLRDPITKEVRYIGKSEDLSLRLTKHLYEARYALKKNHRCNWILKLARDGLVPEIEQLLPVGEFRWQTLERFFIASCRLFGLDIVNSTAGGEGVELITEESIAKKAAAIRALWANPEQRAKRLLAAADPAMNARRAISMKAVLARPDVRARISQTSSDRMNPEVKARWLAKISDPEHQRRNSEAQKARWADPEYRARMSALHRASWALRKAKQTQD